MRTLEAERGLRFCAVLGGGAGLFDSSRGARQGWYRRWSLLCGLGVGVQDQAHSPARPPGGTVSPTWGLGQRALQLVKAWSRGTSRDPRDARQVLGPATMLGARPQNHRADGLLPRRRDETRLSRRCAHDHPRPRGCCTDRGAPQWYRAKAEGVCGCVRSSERERGPLRCLRARTGQGRLARRSLGVIDVVVALRHSRGCYVESAHGHNLHACRRDRIRKRNLSVNRLP